MEYIDVQIEIDKYDKECNAFTSKSNSLVCAQNGIIENTEIHSEKPFTIDLLNINTLRKYS